MKHSPNVLLMHGIIRIANFGSALTVIGIVIQQLLNEAEQDIKNSGDQGGCYPQSPKAGVDNTLRDLQNSSYPTKAKFNNCFMIHSKRFPVLIGVLPFRSVFPFTKHKATSSLGFLNQQFNYLQRAVLLTSLIEYLFNSSRLW